MSCPSVSAAHSSPCLPGRDGPSCQYAAATAAVAAAVVVVGVLTRDGVFEFTF